MFKNFDAGNSLNEDDYDSQCQKSCPEGWQEFDRKCYLWVTDEKKNWTEAENFCKKEGAHLASVTGQEIHNFILEGVGKKKIKVWIGATDRESEGTWKWSDFSPFNFKSWIEEPGANENVNCVELYNTAEGQGWNDLECETLLNFICAKSPCLGKFGICH